MRKYSASRMELPRFNSRTCLEASSTGEVVVLKGAPEVLIDLLKQEIDEQCAKSARVIAIATSNVPFEESNLPARLTLVGIIAVMDKIRNGTKDAVETVKWAGVQTVMITGDKKETAFAIARECGLVDGMTNVNEAVITSEELNKLTDEQVEYKLPSLRVVARALPTDKSRLVKCAQRQGFVVGMTGDGCNDSAALKHADVAFGMGSGAEVAKEAADIIILDDNFQSITKAILYGRTIFKSIRKFIVFQSTVNLASTVIVFLGPFLGFDFPLTLIQLLWVNLVMDTFSALAFGGEPPLLQYMREKPVDREAPIISKYMWSSILTNGLFVAGMSLIW
eukprot:CAMPEP_0168535412 /NCGR_PEP_ID=MMETSP0405-20121227/18674_1 /TAXON_ID=498012 /ORGANISM="Trichosphaerium sp, Strain Am-I-7 wt" /LENGTH=335 /DNA_ID=CAMNT_0008562693 /DNA_START=51 /DNA_END=1055 /DNA_ORIENTATION=-